MGGHILSRDSQPWPEATLGICSSVVSRPGTHSGRCWPENRFSIWCACSILFSCFYWFRTSLLMRRHWWWPWLYCWMWPWRTLVSRSTQRGQGWRGIVLTNDKTCSRPLFSDRFHQGMLLLDDTHHRFWTHHACIASAAYARSTDLPWPGDIEGVRNIIFFENVTLIALQWQSVSHPE